MDSMTPRLKMNDFDVRNPLYSVGEDCCLIGDDRPLDWWPIWIMEQQEL
jgi:hypothetical protein